jgi:hypothetical protein
MALLCKPASDVCNGQQSASFSFHRVDFLPKQKLPHRDGNDDPSHPRRGTCSIEAPPANMVLVLDVLVYRAEIATASALPGWCFPR